MSTGELIQLFKKFLSLDITGKLIQNQLIKLEMLKKEEEKELSAFVGKI
jgi:hypothetical protein